MALSLTSPSFQDHGEIPIEYTHDGKGISPPLAWSNVPAGARSLAVVVEDPDAPDPAAPRRTVVHWAIYNLPPTSGSLPEDVDRHGLPEGAHAGRNDHGRVGYSGPQPPIGRHRPLLQALRALRGAPGRSRAPAHTGRARSHDARARPRHGGPVGTYESKRKRP